MAHENKKIAQKEIHATLTLCNYCIRILGLSFIDEIPQTFYEKLKRNLLFIVTLSLLVLMLISEFVFVTGRIVNAASIEDFVSSYLHIAGYDTLSKFVYFVQFEFQKRNKYLTLLIIAKQSI